MRRYVLSRRSLGLGAAALATARVSAAEPSTAILVIDGDPPTLNLGTTTDFSAGDVGAKLFEGLVWLDPDYRPQPSLATSWDVAEDGKTYTFHLRQGVTWHDGTPFTSSDVAFTFDTVLARLHPRASGMIKFFGITVEAPEPGVFVVHLNRPFAPLLQQLTVFEAPILPRHLYENTDIAANPANQRPVGTGPFMFQSWERGATIHLVRNPHYWDAGKPKLDQIIFQIVPQPANRAPALESGDADEVVDFYLPKPDEVRLLKDASLQHRQGVNIPAIYFLSFNTKAPPLDSVVLRQAVALGLDRPRMVTQVMSGLASPGAGAFGDGFPWIGNPDGYAKLYPFDPAQARERMGTAPGKLDLVYDAARPQMIATAQIVRENLRAIGIDVDLQPMERAAMNYRVYVRREFYMTLQSYFSAGDPAIGYQRLYLTERGRLQITNPSGYSNPEIDRLLGEASTERDRDRRAVLYRQAAAILDVDLPSLVLFDEKTADFASRKLTGLWTALDARDQWAGVALTA